MKRTSLAVALLLASCASPHNGSEPGPRNETPAPTPTQETVPVTTYPRAVKVIDAIPEPPPAAEIFIEDTLEPPVSVQAAGVAYRCPELIDTALSVGWADEHADRLDTVLWRESRCQPEAHNATDPNGGSHGASQVNGFWCRPSRFFPAGWLQTQGILTDCSDLYDPATNLLAALAIFRYSQERNGCGWSPWATKGSRWCSTR